MNERQFQDQLAAEAPMSVPDSLRERVEDLAVELTAATRGRASEVTGRRAPTLGVTDVIRQRQTLASLLLAALLAIGAVAVGTLIREAVAPAGVEAGPTPTLTIENGSG